MNKKNILVYISLLLASLFWGLSFIWVKDVLIVLNPITLVTIRLIISSCFLLIVAKLINKLQKIQKGDFSKFILLATAEPLLYYLGETYGLKYVSSTLASVIISTIPLFVPIAAYYILKVKISTFNIIGLIVSMFGVLLIIFSNSFSLTASPKGILLISFAVLSAVAYTLIVKGLSDKYNSITIVTYQSFFGLLGFLPLFFIFDFSVFVTLKIDNSVLIPILCLAILPSSLSYILFTYGIKNLGVNKSSIFTYAIPVFTATFAYYFLGEEFTARKITGIIIVIIGLTISQINSLRIRS